MKTNISATVSGVIELDKSEQFEVVGNDEYGRVDYKILVERVHNWTESGWRSKEREHRGIKFSGRRVLKDGSTNYQNKTVALDDGDERIPEAIAVAVQEMRQRLDHLRAYIAEEA